MDALCAGVSTRNQRTVECSCSMLALFHNFVLGFLSYNSYNDKYSKPVEMYRGENAAHKFMEENVRRIKMVSKNLTQIFQ